MMDAVHRYDGYVAEALGDGIFALFGAPIAHEDHPQRTLYSALRMQEEMRGVRRPSPAETWSAAAYARRHQHGRSRGAVHSQRRSAYRLCSCWPLDQPRRPYGADGHAGLYCD